ncbi:MAG: type I polyketide synthase, partial [Terriglobia bacterium]
MVVLKRLADAVSDGDNILALIAGSAVNQDGRSSGLTVPNGVAQQALIREALANARKEPAQVSFVETHGTGTSLGDPIEANALGAVLGMGRRKDQPLVIGSVKTNVGHLEAAAGIAGLIKAVLALQHNEIPPNLHFKHLNPEINVNEFPILVPTKAIPWTSASGTRIAGVSSFGLSGTNAHVILEEAPSRAPLSAGDSRPTHVLCLSAKNPAALKQLSARYEDYLATQPATPVSDVCYTANTGRAHFKHRLAIVNSSLEELRARLLDFGAGNESVCVSSGEVKGILPPKVAFLFTGQGGQYVNMGRALDESEPAFRQIVDRCDELLRPHLPKSLRSVLYPQPGEITPLDETAYTHVAMFAVQYGLAQLWRSWGVEPGMVMGHSVGEIVAATVAGSMSLEDGLMIMRERGRLMQSLPATGMMASLLAGEERVAAALAPYRDRVAIAAVNGPESTVISGERTAMQEILHTLEAEGIKTKPLKVSNSFHSPLVEPVLEEFEHAAARAAFRPPQMALFSSMRLEMVGERNLLNAAYWRYNLRHTVRFSEAMRAVYEQGYRVFLEIGPSPILVSMGSQCVPIGESVWLASLKEGRDDWQQMLESLAILYVHGAKVSWTGFDRAYPRHRISLPTYPFQRERYWIQQSKSEPPTYAARIAQQGIKQNPLLGFRLHLAHDSDTYVWENEISTKAIPFLADHRVEGEVVVPAAAFVEMGVAAIADAFGPSCLILSEIKNEAVLVLSEGQVSTVQVILTRSNPAEATFRVFSRPRLGNTSDKLAPGWTLNASGKISYGPSILTSTDRQPLDLEAIRNRCPQELAGTAFYRSLNEKGNQWGPRFQGIDYLWRGHGEALSRVLVPQSLRSEVHLYHFHPALADACGHVLVAAMPLEKNRDDRGGAFVGGGIDEVRYYRKPEGVHFWAHARLRDSVDQKSNILRGDVRLFDETGQLLAEVMGIRLWYLDHGDQVPSFEKWFYEPRWEPKPLQKRQQPVNLTVDDSAGTWLVFADTKAVGEALVNFLGSRQRKCVMVFPGEKYERLDYMKFCVRPGESQDLRDLLEATLGTDGSSCSGIIHLWSVDAPPVEKTTLASLEKAQAQGCASIMHLVQELSRLKMERLPRLWLITQGTQAAGERGSLTTLASATLWGFGRSIALEHSELWGGMVDLDPATSPQESAALLGDELLGSDVEDQIAFRKNQRYV